MQPNETQPLHFTFPGASKEKQNKLAASLRRAVASPDVPAEVLKPDRSTLDIGSVLVAVVAARSVEFIARALYEWMRSNRAEVVVSRAGGRARNIDKADAVEIARILRDAIDDK